VITWREGVVDRLEPAWSGAQPMMVTVGDEQVRALAYPELVGPVEPGATVLLNVSALAKGLGTGGYALVVARTDTMPPDRPSAPGHLVKARYTPLQTMVLGVDEQDSLHHEVLADADDLTGMPVVVADLHSSLPAIIAGLRHAADRAGARPPSVAYVLSDGGALPAWFSRTVGTLRDAGWLDVCVSTGQSFGGDLEAVTVHSGLLAARHVATADVAIVTQGPGNLGTGTRWGFSGVAAGEAINAAGVLRGRPVAALRVSGADVRDRHQGVSHHSLTAYGRVALVPADVVVPRFAGPLAPIGGMVAAQAAALTAPVGLHHLVTLTADDDLRAALAATPVRLSTMGRGLDDDPAAFLAVAVAGVHAFDLVHR